MTEEVLKRKKTEDGNKGGKGAGHRVLALLLAAAVLCAGLLPCQVNAAGKYKKMSGRVVQAQGGDKGKVVGGKPGDQSGHELTTSRYSYSKKVRYKSYKFVVRCTDPAIADRAATFSYRVTKNNNVGFNNYVNNQSGINQRNSLYLEAQKVGFDARKIRAKTAVSCTPLSLSGFRAAGINMNYPIRAKYHCRKTGTYTGNYLCGTVNAESLPDAIRTVNAHYIRQGKPAPFKIFKLKPKQFRKPKKYLKRGDVLCTGTHTVILL